jgi:hypothetical protein
MEFSDGIAPLIPPNAEALIDFALSLIPESKFLPLPSLFVDLSPLSLDIRNWSKKIKRKETNEASS